ncbi:MAG: NUDIX domain-containing protein [Thermoplasmata archaeon]
MKKDDKVLLLKRSDEVKTYQGRWAGISGYLETEKPLDQAEIEIEEETGLKGKSLAKGKTVRARDGDKIWKVHPFFFEVEGEPELDWENQEYEWVDPDEIMDRKTVPRLWEAYSSVRCEHEDKNGR